MTRAEKTSPDYVWEKMLIGVECLCGEGAFNKRLQSAALALHTLETTDLKGKPGEDLRYVLKWTAENLADGRLIRTPDEAERKAIVEKMIRLLCETSRVQGTGDL